MCCKSFDIEKIFTFENKFASTQKAVIKKSTFDNILKFIYNFRIHIFVRKNLEKDEENTFAVSHRYLMIDANFGLLIVAKRNLVSSRKKFITIPTSLLVFDSGRLLYIFKWCILYLYRHHIYSLSSFIFSFFSISPVLFILCQLNAKQNVRIWKMRYGCCIESKLKPIYVLKLCNVYVCVCAQNIFEQQAFVSFGYDSV